MAYSLPPLLSFDWIGYLVLVLVKYIFLADTSITQVLSYEYCLLVYHDFLHYEAILNKLDVQCIFVSFVCFSQMIL